MRDPIMCVLWMSNKFISYTRWPPTNKSGMLLSGYFICHFILHSTYRIELGIWYERELPKCGLSETNATRISARHRERWCQYEPARKCTRSPQHATDVWSVDGADMGPCPPWCQSGQHNLILVPFTQTNTTRNHTPQSWQPQSKNHPSH